MTPAPSPRALILGAGAVLIASALAAWLAGTRALSPLSRIVTAAARVADEGDFSRRLSEHLTDPRQCLEPADLTVRQTESVADNRKDGGCGG